MATTRIKKTVSINPLDRSPAQSNKRKSVLPGVPKTSAAAARSRKANAKDSVKKVVRDAKAQKSVKATPVNATPVKSTRKSVEPKPAKSSVPKEPVKRPAKAATPARLGKPTRKVAAPAPVEKPARKAATAHNQDDVASSASAKPDHRGNNGGSASGQKWARSSPIAQDRDGQVLSVCDIVAGPVPDVVGFYESSGDFVSLMQLQGPIDPPRAGFFSLALAGFAIGGPLGFAAASILSVRKHSIFLARQTSGQHRYVALDLRGLSHLRRMAVKLGR